MFNFFKKFLLSLLLLPFLITPLFAETIRPVVSAVVYNPVWDITSYGGADTDTALKLNLTSTASIDTWLAKYSGSYSRASEMTVSDFEGIYKTADDDVVPLYGARKVTNFCKWSQDISNAAWAKTGTPTVTDNGEGSNKIVTDAPGTENKFETWHSFSASVANRTFLSTIDLKGTPGDQILLSCVIGSPTYTGTESLITLTADWKRYSIKQVNGITSSIAQGFRLRKSSSDPQITFYTKNAHLEEVTGQTNQNPSDHIPTTSAVATKYYNTENGNTVSSNVVTEAAGAALTNTIGAAFWPSTTNVIPSTEYRDFSHTNWNKTNGSITTGDVVLIDGTTVTAKNTFTASAGNATMIKTQYTSASGVHSGGIFIKRKTGTGAIEVTIDGGTTWVAVTTQVAGDSGWHLCQTTLTVENPEFGVRLVTNGDAVYLDWAQIDDEFARVSVHPIEGGATLAASSFIAADAANVSKLIQDTQGYVIAHVQLMPDDYSIHNAAILIAHIAGKFLYSATAFPSTLYNRDGTTTTALNFGFAGYSKIVTYWGHEANKKQLSSNGMSSAVGDYDGDWQAGNILIGVEHNGIISYLEFGVGIKTTQDKMEAATTP